MMTKSYAFIFIANIITTMFGKHEIALGSPKSVTLNILNGNSFFSFDYENNQKIDQMNQTLQNFLGQGIAQDHKNTFRSTTISVKNPYYVQSAQYSRKLIQSNIMNRSSFNPYTRIKRVQNIIEQRKQRQSSLENRLNQLSSFEEHSRFLPQVVECKTERNNKSQQKQIVVKSLTIDPQYLRDQINNHSNHHGDKDKLAKKNINAFSENYKNRRKLVDKISHKRTVLTRISPMRWDAKPQTILQSDQQSKHWSPYSGKLIVNHTKDPLLRTLEGNRIRYVHHEPKYYKGKLQQANKI